MVAIDLAEIPVREANERIREAGARGEDVEVLNPDARHHIGVGLVGPITVRVRGSAGYFCAGLSDHPRFEIENNVGWGVADNMYNGSVVVGGNAGAIVHTDAVAAIAASAAHLHALRLCTLSSSCARPGMQRRRRAAA